MPSQLLNKITFLAVMLPYPITLWVWWSNVWAFKKRGRSFSTTHSVFASMNIIFMVPFLSVLGYTWISFYAFSHSYLLPSPCSQWRGESCPAASQYPRGHFSGRPAPSQAALTKLELSQAGPWGLATGRLVNPAQPCPGQGQPSHPRDLPQPDACSQQ